MLKLTQQYIQYVSKFKKIWLLTKYISIYIGVNPENINKVELETRYAEWIEHYQTKYCKTTFLALHAYPI